MPESGSVTILTRIYIVDCVGAHPVQSLCFKCSNIVFVLLNSGYNNSYNHRCGLGETLLLRINSFQEVLCSDGWKITKLNG